MTLQKVLWIVLVITILVWGGVGVYWYLSSRPTPSVLQTTPQYTSPTEIPEPTVVSGTTTITPGVFEHSLLPADQSFEEQLFTLNYKGFLKEKKGNQWILTSGENEPSFLVSEKTDFFKINGEKVKEPILEADIKTGDYLVAVTLGVWIGETGEKPPQYMETLQDQPVSEVWLTPTPAQ